MRTVTHPEYQSAFDNGFNSMQEFIREAGITAATQKFNLENPADQKFSSLGGYYYADGELSALIANF